MIMTNKSLSYKPKWGQSRPILLVVAFGVAMSSFNVFELLNMNGSLQVDVDKDQVKTAVPTLTEFLNQHSYLLSARSYFFRWMLWNWSSIVT